MNLDEMPREKLIKFGPEYLTDIELLAIILRTGTKDLPVLDLSRKILNEFNFKEISRKSFEELNLFKGIKTAKATQIIALFELARRLSSNLNNNHNKKIQIKNSLDIYNLIRNDFLHLTEERVMLILVNTKNQILKKEFINFGSINYSIIDIRKIIKKVLLNDANGFFIIHNHPSGDPSPSQEDIEITKKIFKVSQDININFLDHIIIGNNYFSFLDNNLLN